MCISKRAKPARSERAHGGNDARAGNGQWFAQLMVEMCHDVTNQPGDSTRIASAKNSLAIPFDPADLPD